MQQSNCNLSWFNIVVVTAQLTGEDLRDGGLVTAAIHTSMESGCVNQVDIIMELFGIIGREGVKLLKKLE